MVALQKHFNPKPLAHLYMNTDIVYLKTIATNLGIRPKRILEKVQKLGLNLDTSAEGQVISVHDAIVLLRTYIGTDKTNTQTKEAANSLIHKLSGKVYSPEQPKPNQPKHRTPRMCVNVNEAHKPTPNIVHKTVRTIVSAIESVHFKFVALIVAIFVQMHHTAEWYHRTVPSEASSWYTSYGYSFMVDLFILVVTMEGKMNIAKTFAGMTFLANILYFQFWVGFDGTTRAVTNAVSCVLISGIMAYIIYAYTELFVKYRNTGQKV